MKNVVYGLVVMSCIGIGCTQMRYGVTSVDQAFHGPVTQKHGWGEVHCSQGVVCAEVEVVRVDVEERDGGRVEVTLHNRTSQRVSIQIALEVWDKSGRRIEASSYENFGLGARGERVYSLPGIFMKGASVRVLLRTRI